MEYDFSVAEELGERACAFGAPQENPYERLVTCASERRLEFRQQLFRAWQRGWDRQAQREHGLN